MQLECVVTRDGHATVNAYAINRDESSRQVSDDNALHSLAELSQRAR